MPERPGTTPAVRHWPVHRTLREGEGTTVRARMTAAADVEHAVVALAPHEWWATKPASGVLGVTPSPRVDELTVDVPVATLRWGVRAVGDGLAAAVGPWAGYRWGPYALLPVILTTLPICTGGDIARAWLADASMMQGNASHRHESRLMKFLSNNVIDI